MSPAQRSHRRRPLWRRREGIVAGGALGAVAIAVVAVVLALHGTSAGPAATSPSPSPAATPTAAPLAGLSSQVTGQPIDGVECQANEQLAYHIHAHLAIFVDGQARSIPEGIGIPPPRTVISTDEGPFVEGGKCYYWLHTHTEDGIIHVESPTRTLYTLGQLFDIWQQKLSSDAVGTFSGTLFTYVNGQRYTGDPRGIALEPHELIQLDVGTDVAPKSFTFPPGL